MGEHEAAKLIVRSHGGQEFEVQLGAGEMSIGRDPDCDIVLDDSYVTWRHARITLRGGAGVLIDEGSTNGTYVGTIRIKGPRVLSGGDEIRIGKSRLVYVRASSGRRPTRRVTSAPDRLPQTRVRVDVQSREVWIEGVKLDVGFSPLEFGLLAYLYERANSVCTRNELGAALWGDGRDAYTPEMLHQLVHRLKGKLEPDPEDPSYIFNVPRVGYRLHVTGSS